MIRFLESLGRAFLGFLTESGGMFLFFLKGIFYFFSRPFRLALFVKQIEFIGVRSFVVVFLTSLFSGMVTAYQVDIPLARIGSQSVLGGVVALTLTRELAPVLTAVVVVARAGSAMCAELGSMRITEQIDALKMMAVNPIQYLISPRLWAGIVALPLLTAISDFIGIAGGYLVATLLLHIDPGMLTSRMIQMVQLKDILSGIAKSVFFGVFLVTVCCYKGFYARGGAEGVGKATTDAVVISTVGILISDYILTTLFF